MPFHWCCRGTALGAAGTARPGCSRGSVPSIARVSVPRASLAAPVDLMQMDQVSRLISKPVNNTDCRTGTTDSVSDATRIRRTSWEHEQAGPMRQATSRRAFGGASAFRAARECSRSSSRLFRHAARTKSPRSLVTRNRERFSLGGAAHEHYRRGRPGGGRAGERKTDWTQSLRPPPGLWALKRGVGRPLGCKRKNENSGG